MVTSASAPALALAACLVGCAARAAPAPAPATEDELLLYRDRALIRHRVEIVAPAAGATRVALQVAAGVGPGDLVILDRGGLAVSALQVAHAPDEPARPAPSRPASEPAVDPEPASDEARDETRGATRDEPRAAPPPVAPTALELVVSAPRAGRYAVWLGYATDRITWQAAYTLTANAARDRAVLRGAIAIRNASGLAMRARTHLLDAPLGAWRDHTAERLAGALLGARSDEPPLATPCDLGVLALGDGETRVGLLAGDPPRRLRSVLVYDPIGTRLDHAARVPIFDPALGAGAAPTRVTESFEIARGEPATRSLPAGPVRLLERRADGSLGMLGESPLFDAATRVADVDTIAVGTAERVTGHRERREWTKDTEQQRFTEEVLITLDNARPRPVEVVVREHLYRGLNWTLAYQSAPTARAVKEGPQQIALRATVPANGQVKVLYVVVYTW